MSDATTGYGIGQIVRFTPGTYTRAHSGLYEVVARLPEEQGEPLYRLRYTGDGHERIVPESQIAATLPVEEPPPKPRKKPARRPKADPGRLSQAELASLARLAAGAATLSIPIGHLSRFRHLGLTAHTKRGEVVTEKGAAEAQREPAGPD